MPNISAYNFYDVLRKYPGLIIFAETCVFCRNLSQYFFNMENKGEGVKDEKARTASVARQNAFHDRKPRKLAIFDALLEHWKRVGDSSTEGCPFQNKKATAPLLSAMRKDLSAFFLSAEARKERLRWEIQIPTDHQPRLVFVEANIVENEEKWQYQRLFWGRFITDNKNLGLGVTIVYTEVLFFRQTTEKAFIRFLEYNGDEETLKEVHALLKGFDNSFEHLKKKKPYLKRDINRFSMLAWPERESSAKRKSIQLRPLRYFVTRGELKFLLRVSRVLWHFGVEPAVVEHLHRSIPGNLVLLGNFRTNHQIRSLVGLGARYSYADFPFRIGPEQIYKLGEKGEPIGKPYEEMTPPADGTPNVLVIYALLTRMPHPDGNRTVLIVAGNHSAAFTSVANLLLSEGSVESLHRDLGLAENQAFPDQFQVLLSARIDQETEELISQHNVAEVVDFHPRPAK